VTGTDINKSTMNFIPKSKKTIAKYTLLSDNTNLGIYPNFENAYTKDTNCPTVNSLKNRFYSVNSPFSLDINFDKNNYNYKFDTKVHTDNTDMHNLIKRTLSLDTMKNGVTNLQMLSPYAFVTDDKELEVTILQPNIINKNVEFATGSLVPHSWIRTINSAWILTGKEGNVTYSQTKPMFYVLFNKPVDLQYIEPTEKIFRYWQHSRDITSYTSNITKHFNYIVNRRPKKLL